MHAATNDSPPLLEKCPTSVDDALEKYIGGLRESGHSDASTTVEDVLQEVRLLERQQSTQSRFRRLAHYLEPLLDFLMMYSPALDVIAQYDANPSALVWGCLRALLQVGARIDRRLRLASSIN